MADTFTSKKNGSLWIQPDGPNTTVYYLGCHDLGDITVPKGSKELQQCFLPDGSGWEVISETEKPPEIIKLSVEVPMGKTADWLESEVCPATLNVMMRDCGLANVWGNYVRGLIMQLSSISSEKYAGLVTRQEDKPSLMSFELEARPPLGKVWKPKSSRMTISETRDLLDIAKCGGSQCASSCGPATTVCQTQYVASKAGGGAASVWKSDDSGATWTELSGHPFSATEDISAIECVQTGNGFRLIAARGTTDAGEEAEVAYSDDDGVTWTNVLLGTVHGTYVPNHLSLFALDYEHIWVGLTDGYIYFSDDAGTTWTLQTDLGAGDVLCIHFMDEYYGLAGGEDNVLAFTTDGGDSWTVIAGPASQAADDITAVQIMTPYHFWITYNDGKIYYTDDGGDTWTERIIIGATPNDIDNLVFFDPLCGWMSFSNTTYLTDVSTIARTIDGGKTWEILDTVSNEGLRALLVCNCNLAYAVGGVLDGTPVIAKFNA